MKRRKQILAVQPQIGKLERFGIDPLHRGSPLEFCI
jgi:hypothetical protein